MTISTEVRKAGPYNGNSVASSFPFTFKIFKAEDLVVIRRQGSIKVDTALVITSDYTVTLNADQNTNPGGSVNLVGGPLPTGFTLVISSDLPFLQPTDLTNQGGFYPQVITNALDRLTIFCQQLAEIAGRTLKLPITAPSNVSTDLPFPEAGKLIGWNTGASGMANYSADELATLAAYGTAKADQFTGNGTTTTFALTANPANVNNLDVSVNGLSKRPGLDYTWGSGTNIVFTVAPPAPAIPGDKNVLVRYMQGLPSTFSDTDGVSYLPPFAGAVRRSQTDVNAEYVRPEDFGALHTAGIDDSQAFHAALATGKRLKLGAHTYRVNIILTQQFDIGGQGMDRTKLIAFDKTKPVVKNMFKEPKWNYPAISKLTISGSGTNEGVGFSFGDFSTYGTGDELIGRVRMTDVYFSNLDKCILKCYGNIGNVFENVSGFGGNYFYYARGAKFGNPSAGIMHAGADLFVGGQVTGMQKMCFLVLDTTPGVGQWTFMNTILQFNPGGTFMWDVSGVSNTAFESTSFINIWNEGNASAGSVTIDGLSGPRTITPSSKFEQTAYGPDYCNWGKIVQHGTTSTLGRVNVWGNERIALNLEAGGIGTGDYVDLAFSSAGFPGIAGAWFRSTRGASFGRSMAIQTAAGISADFNVDGGSALGFAASTAAVPTTANKLRANVSTGGIIAAFVGPFSGITKINMVDNQNYSATLAGMHLGSVTSSGRSLNAAGTLNASGADYAEYMLKDADCGVIPKGAICGITKGGLLTDQFDKAISFVVKSTDPAYVGGDSWGHSPEPERFTPEYVAWFSAKNALLNAEDCKPLPAEGESDTAFAERMAQWEAEVARLTVLSAHEPAQRESDEWLAWETDIEAKRQRVDRIAFSGQVPCNVADAVPGDYIVPVRNSDGSIGGQAVKDPSFEQYRRAVGQVWKVMDDGRAWIAVRVA
jgi:hypothetical protein